MYAIRDAGGRIMGHAKTKAAAHRASRSRGRLGSTVSRNRAGKEVCRCGGYEFPHAPGGGKCRVNRADDSVSRGVRRYWLAYFRSAGLTPSQVERAMELHRKGYDPDVAIRMVRQAPNRADGDDVHDYYPTHAQFMEQEHDYHPAHAPTPLFEPEPSAMTVYEPPVHEAVVGPERQEFLVSVTRLS